MTRWNLSISEETDKALRILLAEQGGGKKGDLSSFVEEAVRKRILELTTRQIKQRNAFEDQVGLLDTIEEAVQNIRASRS